MLKNYLYLYANLRGPPDHRVSRHPSLQPCRQPQQVFSQNSFQRVYFLSQNSLNVTITTDIIISTWKLCKCSFLLPPLTSQIFNLFLCLQLLFFFCPRCHFSCSTSLMVFSVAPIKHGEKSFGAFCISFLIRHSNTLRAKTGEISPKSLRFHLDYPLSVLKHPSMTSGDAPNSGPQFVSIMCNCQHFTTL